MLVARDNPLRAMPLKTVRAAFTTVTAPARWSDLGARGAWAKRPVHLYCLAPDTAITRHLHAGPLAATGLSLVGVGLYRYMVDHAAANPPTG